MALTEIIEGNKLIAEFMGAKLKTYNLSNLPYYQMKDKTHWMPERLVYHSSWDWLMPVVEKIRNDHFVNIEMYGAFVCVWITKDKDLPKTHQKIYSEHTDAIMATYGAVIQFIQWHNKIFNQC